MNPLDWAAIAALAGIWFIYRYNMRALKAQLVREQAVRDAKIREEHDAWVHKIQAREAELKTPSEN